MSKNQEKDFRPFLMRFSEEVKSRIPVPVRYSRAKNLMEVYQNGSWVNSPQATLVAQGSTRVTKINQETTDDD